MTARKTPEELADEVRDIRIALARLNVQIAKVREEIDDTLAAGNTYDVCNALTDGRRNLKSAMTHTDHADEKLVEAICTIERAVE